jgi:hypothetical protein
VEGLGAVTMLCSTSAVAWGTFHQQQPQQQNVAD